MGVNSVRIPGKVMLSGEYAVLYGGTATLMPVPRWMEISETEETPSPEESPVVRKALDLPIPELADFEEVKPLAGVTVDRSGFFHSREDGTRCKLGLGASAAEAAGVIALRFHRAGWDHAESRAIVARYAVETHRLAQGGKGSGADAAACAYARPIWFRKENDSWEADEYTIHKRAKRIPMALAWTGVEANTREMVTRLDDWFRKAAPLEKLRFADLSLKSRKLAGMWFRTGLKQLAVELESYTRLMAEIAGLAGFTYLLPVHLEIMQWAAEHGGFAKPTGAGGGDMVLLIGKLPWDELNRLIIPLEV